MFSLKQVNKNRRAFTLAEVLITLLVIGVVGSLVIPAMINNTQNQEFAVLLKKDVSTLSDAAKKMAIDNGGTLAELFNNAVDMQDKFGNYIIFTKKCPAGTQGCFYEGTNTWKTLHGDDGWIDHVNYFGHPTAILNNGGSIILTLINSNCEENYGTGSVAEHVCGWLHLDVNGLKGPNILGRDLFTLWITKTGIYPYGTSGDLFSDWNIYCNKINSNTYSGRSCAAKILSGKTVD